MPTGATDTTTNDALKRAARTFVQTFIALFLALTVQPHATPGTIPSWDTLKVAALAALWGAVASVLSYAQNALEDGGFLPVLFGGKTAAVVAPKPDDPLHVVEHVVSVAPVKVTVLQVLPEVTQSEVQKVVEERVSLILGRAAQLATQPVEGTPTPESAAPAPQIISPQGTTAEQAPEPTPTPPPTGAI